MASNMSSRVALYMRALDLPNKDTFSKTDAFVVIYVKNRAVRGGGETEWAEVYRSPTVKDNLNPQWPEAGIIEYRFEEKQFLRFDIYDRDKKTEALKKQDFIGTFTTTLSKLLAAEGSTVSGRLKKKNGKELKKAKFIVSGEEVAEVKDLLDFQVSAEKLDRKNFGGFGSADPFFVISSQQPSGKMVRVYESPVIKKSRKPKWSRCKIPVVILNNGDYSRKLVFDFFDWESDGDHNYIGSFETTLEELQNTHEFNIKNPKKKKKSSGTCIFDRLDILDRSTFLEFIQGGCEMKLTFAIDFTGSNGHPTEKHSLHYMPGNFLYKGGTSQAAEMNDYQKVLVSVGQVVQDYDTDRKFPVYGFGANLGPGPMDMHCFPLTLSPKKHKVKGIKGVMKAYQHSLQHVTLSGPTHFAPVINQIIRSTPEVTQAKQAYSILLIITDGVVNDLPKTIDAIIEASSKPISIIIVGVGDEDFSPMQVLDGDDGKLSQNGRSVARDIVQFVSYSEFRDKGFTALAEEVLKEVPYQMESFFKVNGIKPNDKTPINEQHYEPLPELEGAFDSDDEDGDEDEDEV